ncbi:MAG: hypothetical protein MZU79_01135 [Anaerotruncus sp.]|nr:hypothetical protein [Anaerotruncus sp.]
MSMRKKLIAFLVVFALIASAVPAFANEPTEEYIIPDVLLVRPIGLAAIVLGFGDIRRLAPRSPFPPAASEK